jgi:hypothetical protein
MHRRIVALSALTLVSLPVSSAFVITPALSRGSAKNGANIAAHTSLPLRAARPAPVVLSMVQMDTGVPEGQKAFEAGERSMDEWFSLLADR